ncbi:uncharacterized protein PG998_004524 [Apiospora kogelbergensis]|uniref:uncharacterized protein n=1 Tax=Apiospora kogelbergensis TaxID=1337665 RepID=UPI00312ECBF2
MATRASARLRGSSLRTDTNAASNTDTSTSRISTRRGPARAARHTTSQDAVDKPPAPKRRKKELPSYLRRSDDEAQSDQNRHTFLGRMPPEILTEISKHSTIDAAVCLALTCKLALALLGTQWLTLHRGYVKGRGRTDVSWHDLQATDFETDHALQGRVPFLELLLRDLREPGHKLCNRCEVIHPPLKPPAEHTVTKWTKGCEGNFIDYLPHSMGGGYNILLAHIVSAFERRDFERSDFERTPIDGKSSTEYLAGNLQIPHPQLRYHFSTTADWVNGNLILRHKYQFSRLPEADMHSSSITRMPFRLCPHQATTDQVPPKSRYLPDQRGIGPLLLYSIETGMAGSKRSWSYNRSLYRPPTSREQKQMDMDIIAGGNGFTFKCDKCPTKWRVLPAQPEQFTIEAFHCFGKDWVSVIPHFRSFLRRSGPTLGMKKRNDEWWSTGWYFPDFEIE